MKSRIIFTYTFLMVVSVIAFSLVDSFLWNPVLALHQMERDTNIHIDYEDDSVMSADGSNPGEGPVAPAFVYDYVTEYHISDTVSEIRTSFFPDSEISLVYEHRYNEGIFIVNVSGSRRDFVIRLRKGNEVYTYRLKPDEKTVVPYNMGDGRYTIGFYIYTAEPSVTLLWRTVQNIELSSEQAPYLNPSAIVNWTDDMALVNDAKNLVVENDSGATAMAICRYIAEEFTYDYSITELPNGYRPDLYQIYENRKGFCYDFAALYTAMCRSVGIPTKLVMGYNSNFDTMYHAWCMVLIDGEWLMVDPTYSLSGPVEFMNTEKAVMERYY